jgi:hypothetical protein
MLIRKTNDGGTLLMFALNGQEVITRLLLERKEIAKNEDGLTALYSQRLGVMKLS